MKYDMEQEIPVAYKHLEDPETAIEQKQDNLRNADKVGLTTRE
jgi:hypothetical protein